MQLCKYPLFFKRQRSQVHQNLIKCYKQNLSPMSCQQMHCTLFSYIANAYRIIWPGCTSEMHNTLFSDRVVNSKSTERFYFLGVGAEFQTQVQTLHTYTLYIYDHFSFIFDNILFLQEIYHRNCHFQNLKLHRSVSTILYWNATHVPSFLFVCFHFSLSSKMQRIYTKWSSVIWAVLLWSFVWLQQTVHTQDCGVVWVWERELLRVK